jgi:hypothetical protein
MTKRGEAGTGSKGRGGAKHGQACTNYKERTRAEAVRALESAVQVGRGDEGKQKWPTLRNVGIRYRCTET